MEEIKTIAAKLKYLRITPRKTRFVADIIRGLPIEEAETQLMFSSRRASVSVLKLLRSAAANAKHNYRLEPSNLYVKEIKVDQGPKYKRWTPRARGSVGKLEKKTSHITLILGVLKEPKQPKFRIEPKPKKKTARKDKKAQRKEVPRKTESEVKIPEKRGFFRKVFRRKSV